MSGYHQAISKTREFLAKGAATPLFEATFEHTGVVVRADILRPGPDGCHLIEIKSAAHRKDYHLKDCAVQYWVIESAGHSLAKVELGLIDSSFVYPGGGNYGGLFRYEDVTEEARRMAHEVQSWVAELAAMLAGSIPDVEVGGHCHDPFDCPFVDYCTPEGPEYPVSCLPRAGALIEELLAEGILDIRDIPEGRLGKPVHQRIRRATIAGAAEVSPGIAQELSGLAQPWFYLDFETIQFAIPIWAGTRPYEQLPFQWSCHIGDAPGGLCHEEFLDLSGEAPMLRFAEALLETIGSVGPIFVYSHFEKRILRELSERFPLLSQDIFAVIDRLVDLLPIMRNHYYHPEMLGSWSIKAVLPTIAPELDYAKLKEVQNGTAAQAAYLEAISPETSHARKEELRERMLRYCEMDTLAMVEIVQYIKGI